MNVYIHVVQSYTTIKVLMSSILIVGTIFGKSYIKLMSDDVPVTSRNRPSLERSIQNIMQMHLVY